MMKNIIDIIMKMIVYNEKDILILFNEIDESII
jgi:hypothetical protein